MTKLPVVALIIVVLANSQCGYRQCPDVPPTRVKRASSIRHDPKPWERIFFEEINERLAGSDLIDLKDVGLSGDSMEIRIWVGFDTSPLRGMILRRENSDWYASYLRWSEASSDLGRAEIPLPPPKKGWEDLWRQLNAFSFLELPDHTEIGMEPKGFDTTCVVVEIATQDSYRTYLLFGLKSPDGSKPHPTQSMYMISKLLAHEFGMQMFTFVYE